MQGELQNLPVDPDAFRDKIVFVGASAVGVERSILTSDLGQPENPIHTSGLVTFFEQLRQRGFTEAEIRRMSRENPARFLGLP